MIIMASIITNMIIVKIISFNFRFLTNSVETFPHLDRDSADVARFVMFMPQLLGCP